MHKKICTRCGKRESFRESLVPIKYSGKEMYLCSQCDQIPFKMKDAINDSNIPLFNQLSQEFVKGIKAGPLSLLLTDWLANYRISLHEGE